MHVASVFAMLAIVFFLESPYAAFGMAIAFNTLWTFAEGVAWAYRMEKHMGEMAEEMAMPEEDAEEQRKLRSWSN